MTSPDQVLQDSLDTSHLPTRASVAAMSAFQAFFTTYPGTQVFVDNLQNVLQARPSIPQYPRISTALGQAIVTALQGQASPQDALNQAAEQANGVPGDPGIAMRSDGSRARERPPDPAVRPRGRLGVRVPRRGPDRRVRHRADRVVGADVVPEDEPALHAGVGRARQLPGALRRTRCSRRRSIHAVIYAALFVPLSVGRRAVRGGRPEPEGSAGCACTDSRCSCPWSSPPSRRRSCSSGCSTRISGWRTGCSGRSAWARSGSSRARTARSTRSSSMTVWGWIGFDAIIYLAALQGVPQELLEAASIDGAGPGASSATSRCRCSGRRRSSSSCSPRSTRSRCSTRCSSSRRAGRARATYVPVLYLYKLAFQQGIAGYAAAIAYVLLIAILILTVIQLWVGKRMVYYAS